MRKVAVLGAGYVGATTSIMLAHLGNAVTTYDVDVEKIQTLNSGRLTIYESGLQEYLEKGIESKKLKFTEKIKDAVEDAEFVFICVPTPSAEDGSADLRFVYDAVTNVSEHLLPGAVLITKSTVPVGSVEEIKKKLKREDISIASNPEFLREGSAVWDFLNPDRIVIGADDRRIADEISTLFAGINSTFILTDPKSAELIKYASNSFLAIKLSYINEIARLCESLDANIVDVMTGFGSDKRIGERFTIPGPGWGGSCFPKDTMALAALGKMNHVDLQVIQAAVASNTATKRHIVSKLRKLLGGELQGRTIAIWGLTFKAFTDDTRESPAVEISSNLANLGATVRAFDPQVKKLNNLNFQLTESLSEATLGADALLVLTEWPEFQDANLFEIANSMQGKIVFDTRNILDKNLWSASGFDFFSFGSK